MNTAALIEAELAGDLQLITQLSEAAIVHEVRAASATSVFVALGAKGDRAGFEAEVLVRDVNGRVRTVALIAVLLDAPGDQVATVNRDILREELDLTGAFAALSADERHVGCQTKPFSWIEGLYRDAIRRRFARRRFIKTIKAIRRHRIAFKEE